jgi:molecular chaperone DnaJ
MSDIFEDIFGDFMGARAGGGGGRGSQSRLRGSDLRYNLEITLEEAYAGRTVEIDVPTLVSCETCEGSGAKPGTGMSTCRHCNGYGKVRAAQGFFTIERTCPVCQGRGQMLDQPCTDCGGEGRRQQNRKLSVDVPKGIEDGTRIRLANEGEAGLRGGPPGDLYIFVSVKPHDLFQRDGADLYARVPIAMTTAALGGEFEVPTLDTARARVKVAPGTQPGQRVRLKGKGMPVLRSRDTGDLYVQLDVETPQALTKRQRELLEEFEKASTKENSPTSGGFFDKLKNLFQD